MGVKEVELIDMTIVPGFDTSNLQPEAFPGDPPELFAILSHVWDAEEISFQEIQCPTDKLMSKLGYKKVKIFSGWARNRKLPYAWVDTCCIDKSSSAELGEAINSTFRWYYNAKVCIVYLSDVPPVKREVTNSIDVQKRSFLDSRWFTRGFTLQELVARRTRCFLASDWSRINDSLWNEDILDVVSKITNIKPNILNRRDELWNACIAERMSWAARRRTTRPEDRAYSLMGIFRVNMAVLYGEGFHVAFRRLQQEIMKVSFDQTLFAWRDHQESSGLLASSPFSFRDTPELGLWAPNMLAPTTATNIGILIGPCIVKDTSADTIQAVLQYDVKTRQGWMYLLLRLKRIENANCFISGKRHNAYRRISCDRWLTISSDGLDGNKYEDILVLEDDNYALVANAQRQDNARWSNDSFGRMPLTLKIDNES